MYIADTFKLKNITCIAPGIPGFGDWVCGGVESWGKANGVAVKQVIFDARECIHSRASSFYAAVTTALGSATSRMAV